MAIDSTSVAMEIGGTFLVCPAWAFPVITMDIPSLQLKLLLTIKLLRLLRDGMPMLMIREISSPKMSLKQFSVKSTMIECFVNKLETSKFAIMIEDPILTEYRVTHISKNNIVHTEGSEEAFALESVNHGTCSTMKECQSKLKDIAAMSNTLGFEIDLECDFVPFSLETYTSAKTLNAKYGYGEHQPDGSSHSEPCRFQVGEKVLCVIHEGYDAVFPGIVVGPLTCEYLEELYRQRSAGSAQSREEFIDSWLDWNWDSVIVRPLVHLRNDWEEMGETVIINRVYLFPYKEFEI